MSPGYRSLAREALAAQREGHAREAALLYGRAVQVAEAGDPPEDLDSTLGNLGSLLYDLGELPQAEEHLRQGIRLAKRSGHAATEGALLRYLARVHRDQGRMKEALQELDRSTRLLEAPADAASLLSTLLLAEEASERSGDFEGAEAAAARALEVAGVLGRSDRVAELKRRVARLREILLSRSDRETLWEELRNLLRLQQITTALNSELDLKRLLDLILDAAIEIAGAERGFLLLTEDGGSLAIATARNLAQEDLRKPEFRFSRSIAQRCLASGEAVRVDDALSDARFDASESVKELKLRSVFCVPFRAKGRVTGALYLDHPYRKEAFRAAVQRMLEGLCDQAAIAMENASLHRESQERRAQLERRVALADWGLSHPFEGLVARAPAMREAIQRMERLSGSELPVLILGESGTGKELAARALHQAGPRKHATFLALNCASLPPLLLESELFGHRRGAFSGAVKDQPGLFQSADKGTLFLDEIGEMSPSLQAKLLRVLEQGEVHPVGASAAVHVDVRILAATHRDLEDMIAKGLFRQDLYFRLKVLEVRLPPLRERAGDIPLLIAHFLKGVPSPPEVVPEALTALSSYGWPGNVRQLQNEVKRWTALSLPRVGLEDLSEAMRGIQVRVDPEAGPAVSLREAVAAVEREAIRKAMTQAGGAKSAAARILGISRPTLDKKLKELGPVRARPAGP